MGLFKNWVYLKIEFIWKLNRIIYINTSLLKNEKTHLFNHFLWQLKTNIGKVPFLPPIII